MKNFTKVIFFLFLLAFIYAQSVYGAELKDIIGNKNQAAIEFLYEKGVISGYPDGTFKPEVTLNRAELLKLLVASKKIGDIGQEYKNCFPDVKEEWFAKYVCFAKSNGWIEGYPDGFFKPSKTVNKVEAIKMMVKIYGYLVTADNSISFVDIDLDQWYAPFIITASSKGLLEENGFIYGVNEEMNRGKMSETIYRAMLIEENGLTSFKDFKKDDLTKTFYDVDKVIDGDTISVIINGKTEVIRLIGLDTPETTTNGSECFGIEATSKAKEVLQGAKVDLVKDETQGDMDKYGRLLRYVFLQDGNNFSKLMILNGYGYEYTYKIPYAYQDELKQAELDAQKNNRGLWADNACEIKEETEEIIDQNLTNGYVCSYNKYNCTNFDTHIEAQSVFDMCKIETGYDVHKLDSDADGKACETLN